MTAFARRLNAAAGHAAPGIPVTRRPRIAALAAALRVSETELTGGPHLTADPVQSNPHTYIPSLRVALETNSLHDAMVERARPVSELAALMSGPIEQSRRASDYVSVGKQLPDLIDELYLHIAQPAGEVEQSLALETLVEAAMCAAGMAKNLVYPDLAYIAALRAQRCRDDAATIPCSGGRRRSLSCSTRLARGVGIGSRRWPNGRQTGCSRMPLGILAFRCSV